ncbi:leukocyte elastase inhibitor-like [Octopus sinensis]|uniref:Leukocyte elastase inhibitor-like n=1 Tax=Octopus sinensis TaxID=2607531 RepID=A0A6P7TBF3_9MOLL|nr:leukocyte elastase inhibitor-like [Octopus sinensis]XP_029648325.1 leukocyte elastase inhibitor-like [Octopus sinensis]XP_029648443.1 leukocyte elastase inhibitor-like [Octopus sinensis]XP_029648444.1 leukocyte elastase inhibitor-like [Octopus sinensis]XP_036367078.1 leukocyte elastase inhibitor-like [Octopus sinensis]XP_036367129.1 leukocyte elastase inhibitor-like [Octopus sinensis]
MDSAKKQDISNLAASIDYFTNSLYQAVATGINENVFMSPFSVATVLSMVYLGARQNSAKQFENVLKITSNPDSVALAFKEYFSLLKNSDKRVTSNLVNRLCANEKFPISEDYKNNMVKYFFSDIENVDFITNAEKTRITINDWVKNTTNNKITDLLPSGSLTPQSVLVLINAVYFKGTWAEIFSERATSSRKFYLSSDKTVSHDFMYLSEGFNSKISDNYKVVELRYIGKAFSMFVILPNEINGLAALEKEINAQFLKDIIDRKGFEGLFLELRMPKFRLESSFQLGEVLIKLGLSDIFDPQKADLSGMTGGEKNIYASEMFHKAFVEVNEEGTEAAAATGMFAMDLSGYFGMPMDFDVNHPFTFLIVDNQTKMIHFIGKVTNPTT